MCPTYYSQSLMHFIKSHLARIGKHNILGPPKPSEEPLANQESTSTPYIHMVLPNPHTPTLRKEQMDIARMNQIVGERTWHYSQLSVVSGTSSSSSKPAPLDTAPNYRLPFDILVQIFEQFAEIEDASSPLERILEVCHFWRDTALDHRTLWTTFRIGVSNHLDFDYWKKRFPQRADRFVGSGALLDISIGLANQQVERLVLPRGTYQVDSAASPTHRRACYVLRILRVVSGRHGALAVRWRSLSLNLLHLGDLMDQDNSVLDRFLEARTPHLESLELYGIVTPYQAHKRIFPYTPRLRRAVFHSCQVSHYPDTSTLTSLTWYSIQDTSAHARRNNHAIHALTSAQKITYLEIGLDWTYWETPMVFQRVKTLKMPGTVYPDFVIMIQMPSLRHLGIGIDPAAKFSHIHDCRGIPVAQVETLELFYVPLDRFTIEEIAATPHDAAAVEGLKVLFAQLINLRVLSWDEEMVTQKVLLKFVLELFTRESIGDDVIRAGSITKRAW